MKTRFYFLPVFLLLGFSIKSSLAVELADCSEPKGYGYVSNFGAVPKDRAGWIEDKMSGGAFKVVTNNEALDLIYIDSSGQIYSTKGNGGFVHLLRVGPKNFTIMAGYEGDTLELYSFIEERTGDKKMHILSSKGGSGQINKSSVMVASCRAVDFDSLSK